MNKKLKGFISVTNTGGVLASLVAIAIGLIVGFVVLVISNYSDAWKGFATMLMSGFSSRRNMGQVLYFATPILMTGLSVGFANRTGLFNIGASGQLIVGAYAAILVGVKCTFLPGILHCIAALIAAMLAGALWGAVPGFLKAFRNVNEVISCIMMNYIGMYLVNFLIKNTVYKSTSNESLPVQSTANLPKLGFDKIFTNSSANSGIIVAIIAAIVIYIVLQKTQFGYELKACGFNRDAAKYAGINERKSIILSMVIAGALAGLGGALIYLAGSGKYIKVEDVLAAEGFNGIPVALLASNNPVGIIFAALFVSYLSVGGTSIQSFFAPQVIEIIIAIIIYFSAFALVIRGIIKSVASRSEKRRGEAHE